MSAENDLRTPTDADRDDSRREATGPRTHVAHEKKVKADKAEKEKFARG